MSAGVWACGSVGVWVYWCVGVWVCGSVGVGECVGVCGCGGVCGRVCGMCGGGMTREQPLLGCVAEGSLSGATSGCV